MNTLYDYYKKIGIPMPSVSQRASTASQAGIKNYTGTANENATLLSYLNKPKDTTQKNVNQSSQGIVNTQNSGYQEGDDEVIGAGSNAGMTVGDVRRREEAGLTPQPDNTVNTDPNYYANIKQGANESNADYANRLRNSTFLYGDENNASGYSNLPASQRKDYSGLEYNPSTGTYDPKVNTNTGTGAITTKSKLQIGNADKLSADPNTLANIYKKFSLDPSQNDSSIDALVNKKIAQYQSTSDTPIDEEAVRKSFKDRIQGSLDAINQTYATMLGNARLKGQNNQGVSRAINARSGLLGSDFASANEYNIGKANQDNENSIEAERLGLITKLMNDTEDKSTDFIRQARQDREDANTKLMDSILTRETRTAGKASKVAQYLLSQGFTNLNELSPDDLKKIEANFGVDQATITDAFTKALTSKTGSDLDTKIKQNTLDKDRYISISDGAQLYDKQTGKIVENTKNFAPNKYSGGGTGTGTGSGSGTGIDANGKTIKLSSAAQTWVDKINREGGKPSDYITGTSISAQNLRNEVQAGLNAQGGVGNFDKSKNMQLIDVVDSTISDLSKNKDLVGTFGTRTSDNKWLNWSANKNTNFVNQVDKLTGQLLKLDGVALKAIFGPQISNSDASTIKEIIGNALDPKNQTPEAFQQSLDDITAGLNEYRKNNSVPTITPASKIKDDGAEYNYERDMRLAQDAIAKGADETQVMARFHAKYK